MKRVPPPNLTPFLMLACGGAVLDLTSKWLVFNRVGQPPAKLPEMDDELVTEEDASESKKKPERP